MQVIPLQAIANQEFSIPLDNNQWDISVKSTNGTISVTLVRNSVIVIENLRAVGGMRIIPSEYEEAGNFAIITRDYEVPDYNEFGKSQTFVYISQAELDLLRQQESIIIKPSDFDPNGALPLRIFPQGYTLAP